MEKSILSALYRLGFSVSCVEGNAILGEMSSQNNGVLEVYVDLRDNTVTATINERFASTHLFLIQKFKDADYLTELFRGNYAFQEWFTETTD
ncbi:hypothetical protein [Dyadobacter sp. 676]|uniref:Uncharacterized protein n=1 Tax=Dyadobacter sp. 676 TaxID=3088362 RepID=A0AAU8FLR0_9BACT